MVQISEVAGHSQNNEDRNSTKIEKSPSQNPSSSTPRNDYPPRIAGIMRNYLHIKQSAISGHPPSPPAEAVDRCRAMMEVVRKEDGRWRVSKLVIDHNHRTDSCADSGVLPELGMEFDSIEAAKGFYCEYGEKNGFKARTGSNRQSAGSGDPSPLMQRFLCQKGSYLKSRCDKSSSKGKRGAYRKIVPKQKFVEVAQVESYAEKGGVVQSKPQKEDAVAEDGNVEKGKDVGGVNNDQSQLLRELGVRVSRYNSEERRDIVLKYMMKKNSRQGVERPVKIALRPALGVTHHYGIGGSFLSRDEFQTLTRKEKMTQTKSAPTEDDANAGGEPKVGMMFLTEDRAYEFYIRYAGNVGFNVRKGWWEKSARSATKSRVFVCSKEGFRPKNSVNETKRPRPGGRTCCPARMAIKMTPSGKYSVSEFVAEHNHHIETLLGIQMLKTHKLLAEVKLGGRKNANLIPADYKNYLRSKRTKDMPMGDAGAILEYFQKMKGENPSFFYAIQIDEDDQLTNFFWADARSIMDYYYFGDVVCFDTSYNANDYGRPFSLFIGVNHHKQAVIFGAALLYDESIESFKWLFETFKTAMSGKLPKTVLIDQCAAIVDAITAVWPGTSCRLCAWHIYQNSTKHVSQDIQGSETFLADFYHCLHDYWEEDELLSAWKTMLEKYDLKDNEWLAKLYEERGKWAMVYGREAFYGDIQNTLRSQNLNIVLKEYLSSETNLSHFFERYGKLADDLRYAEQQADHHGSQGMSRIPPLRLLWQATNAYTPEVFEMFRLEFELFINCVVNNCHEIGSISQYEVTVNDKTKMHFVKFDSSDGSFICTCKKFEFTGIQCCHVLKVLEQKNMEELPMRYILKRWRKDAKVSALREDHGFAGDGDPKSSFPKRYSSLCHILYKIAARAAEKAEAYAFIESQSDQLLEQVEQILQTRLLENTSLNTASKGQPQNQGQNGIVHHYSNSGLQRVNGKGKKDRGARRRHSSDMQPINKRQKGRRGQADEREVSSMGEEEPMTSDEIPSHPRNPSDQFFALNQFMQVQQRHYVPGHQFGLGPIQGFHGMPHYNQETSVSTSQQQPFPESSHISQDNLQPCPAPDMQTLQFVANGTQLGNQSSEPGHYTIPHSFFRFSQVGGLELHNRKGF